MITVEDIMSIDKSDLQEASKALNKDDIPQLVEWLSLKDDNIRYQAFLLLQSRSLFADDVYPYWYIFQSKLQSDNSYQRSIGLMLIAENAKWDTENRMDNIIEEYLALLGDEKPITIRQCIRSLASKIARRKAAVFFKSFFSLPAYCTGIWVILPWDNRIPTKQWEIPATPLLNLTALPFVAVGTSGNRQRVRRLKLCRLETGCRCEDKDALRPFSKWRNQLWHFQRYGKVPSWACRGCLPRAGKKR